MGPKRGGGGLTLSSSVVGDVLVEIGAGGSAGGGRRWLIEWTEVDDLELGGLAMVRILGLERRMRYEKDRRRR